jgi:methylmalonyl-CoA decarboxylase subunit alpha
MDMRELVKDLERRRDEIKKMGGDERVAKQHSRGKLTARERFARFFDDGVFFEVGMHGTQMGMSAGTAARTSPRPTRSSAASARSTVAWCARRLRLHRQGRQHRPDGEEKVTRMRQMALRGRWPMVWFIDSGGARIDPGATHGDAISLFAGSGTSSASRCT